MTYECLNFSIQNFESSAKTMYEPAHEISVFITLTSNEVSGKPAQMHRLNYRAFVVYKHKVCGHLPGKG